MSLIAELRRRNVFRVAIAYIIVAWLTIQVIDVLVPILSVPEVIGRVLILVLIVGFPLALILAWAFELTPEGIKKEHEVDRSKSVTPNTARKLDFVIIGVLTVALVMFAVDKFVLSPGSSADQVASAEIISIAVLPFADMSPDKDQEYFSDGITEEILNDLAKIKLLKVAARTSSFAFKGRNEDLREIGLALGVQNVLEGSIRKDGNKLRITAQLINVSDGFHLWSETYDRELEDIFRVQDEISASIVTALKGNLFGEAVETKPSQQIDVATYEKYLQARTLLSNRSNQNLTEARAMFEEIVSSESEFAPAYAALGETILLLRSGFSSYGDIPGAEAIALADPLITKALQLDPDLAEAHAARGLLLYDERQWADSERSLLRAVELNPSLSNAWNWLSNNARAQNRTADSLRYLEEASAVDPLWLVPNSNVIFQYQDMGRYDEVWSILDRLRPFHETSARFHNMESNAYFAVGQLANALKAGETAYELDSDTPSIGLNLARTRVTMQAFDQGLAVLPEQFALFRPYFTGEWAAVLPLLAEALKGDPREPIALGAYLDGLSRIGEIETVVDYYDQYISSPESLMEFQQNGLILTIARAMQSQGRIADKDSLLGEFKSGLLEREANQMNGSSLDSDWASYYATMGDREQALARLQIAIDRGVRIPDWKFWPELSVFAGDPKLESIKQQHLDAINVERVKVGWEPVAAIGVGGLKDTF
jgi:TolB-like protein